MLLISGRKRVVISVRQKFDALLVHNIYDDSTSIEWP